MKTRSKDHDFATVARHVVEQAIGEHLDGTPLDDPNKGKNPAAVALGKLGGAKGGAARAAALSPAKRKAIAKESSTRTVGLNILQGQFCFFDADIDYAMLIKMFGSGSVVGQLISRFLVWYDRRTLWALLTFVHRPFSPPSSQQLRLFLRKVLGLPPAYKPKS